MPLGHWLRIQLKKVLTSLLWEMKKAVKILIVFFFFSHKNFLTRFLTSTLRALVSMTHIYIYILVANPCDAWENLMKV